MASHFSSECANGTPLWQTITYGTAANLFIVQTDSNIVLYGPAGQFPRAWEVPAGPPSDDAVLITCAYLVDPNSPWVMQSLFLSAIGDARDKGAKAVETFGYRYPEGTSPYERFLVHRTIFPSDFLVDFGFYPLRWDGEVALARLEVGGLQPVAEGPSALVWRKVKEALVPPPMPERPV